MSTLPLDGPEDPLQPDNEELLLIGWKQFCAEYPDEPTCVETVWDASPPSCKKCGGLEVMRAYGDRIGRCRQCQTKVRLTAGTFFNGVRKLRPWLAAIWLTEFGITLTSLHLERLGGVVQSTAWNILTKMRMVLEHDMSSAEGAVQVNLGIFRTAFGKRSLVTPAREHPAAEQAEVESKWLAERRPCERLELHTDESSDGVDLALEPEDELADLYESVSNLPEPFDTLLARTGLPAHLLGARLEMLQLGGWIERLPGDQYKRLCTSQFSENLGSLSELQGKTIDDGNKADIIEYLGSFHGVSRKYVQLYLASYWCKYEPKKWSAGNLLRACCRFPEINYLKIRSFVSPLLGTVVLRHRPA